MIEVTSIEASTSTSSGRRIEQIRSLCLTHLDGFSIPGWLTLLAVVLVYRLMSRSLPRPSMLFLDLESFLESFLEKNLIRID